jgi:hypothetical protein
MGAMGGLLQGTISSSNLIYPRFPRIFVLHKGFSNILAEGPSLEGSVTGSSKK